MATTASNSRARTQPVRRRRRFRPDPVLAAALLLVAGIVAWSAAPLATGALAPASSDLRIEVEVPSVTSVTPGWQSGDTEVRLPNMSIPGPARDVTSAGWGMSTNWANGYEVRIRATTDPALRGRNAVDGSGAGSSFQDYRTTSCPCPWSGDGYDRGIFGYSVSVDTVNGAPALDTAKWGNQRERKWRGFTKASYRAYSTAGGAGKYTMDVHLRSMIPNGAVQEQGSYRAGLVVSAHPLL